MIMKTRNLKPALTAAACAVFLLSGCASNALLTEEEAAVVGAAWHEAPLAGLAEGTPDVRLTWWSLWNDAELMKLIERATANSTDVRAALANLKLAAVNADQATADLFPTLGLKGNGSWTKREGEETDESWSAQGQASWSISLLGGNVAERRAARYEALASILTLEDVKSATAAEVASDYVGLKLAQVKRRTAQATLQNYAEACDIAQWRRTAGLVDQAEVDQAVSNRETARASLALTEKSIAQYRNALARLTVQNASDIVVADDGLMPEAPMALAVSVPAEILKQRPDLRAAQLAVAAASERVYKARTQWFPTLTLTGSLGTQAATIGTLGASGTGVGALAAALAMPLLNWGEQVTATKSAEVALEKARNTYLATLLSALEGTENALTAIKTAQTRQKPLAAALSAAESAADLTMKSYRSGLVDYQNVLSTQRTLLAARENAHSNEADLATGLVTLYRALGGAWKPTEQQAQVLLRLDEGVVETN